MAGCSAVNVCDILIISISKNYIVGWHKGDKK